MTAIMPGRRGKPPRTDAEWAREVQRRLEALESATTLRIGVWVLSVNSAGDLIASTAGGTVILAATPQTGITTRSALEGRGAATAPTTPTLRNL